MSTNDDFNDAPPKKGMSSTSKVLIILGSIGGLCLLACCGGGVFLFYKAKDIVSFSVDPVVVKKTADEIILIDVPSEFTPTTSMKFSMGMSMRMAMFAKAAAPGAQPQSMIMLMEMNQPGMAAQGGRAGAKQQRDQMLQAIRQQQAQQGGHIETEIDQKAAKTRKFKINGEPVEFEFVQGTRPNNGGGVHQVAAVFQGKGGVVMLMMMIDEKDYDEEAVVTMIKSIRMDASTPAGSVTEIEEDDSEKTAEETEDMKEEAEKSE
jgi:hypothetical protein